MWRGRGGGEVGEAPWGRPPRARARARGAAARLTPSAGPRHIEFAPDGGHAYSVNELDNTVTAYDYEQADGVLAPAQTVSTLPEGWSADPPTEVYSRPSHAAELLLSADGRFCYVRKG